MRSTTRVPHQCQHQLPPSDALLSADVHLERWEFEYLGEGPNGPWWDFQCEVCRSHFRTSLNAPLVEHQLRCSWYSHLPHNPQPTSGAYDPPPTGRGQALPSMGDVEQNPGPKHVRTERRGHTLTNEDWMLDPRWFRIVVANLSPDAPPRLDAFAGPNNTQLPQFWSHTQDAFRQQWTGGTPIWANPPFSMLPAVLDKITHQGGHLILLAPDWSPALPNLVALATATFLLPRASIYRLMGAKLMQPPAWRTVAMIINTPGNGTSAPNGTTPTTPPETSGVAQPRTTTEMDLISFAKYFGELELRRKNPRSTPGARRFKCARLDSGNKSNGIKSQPGPGRRSLCAPPPA